MTSPHNRRGSSGRWTEGWADTGFIDLMCLEPEKNATCYYTDPYFKVNKPMKMAEQFDRKYVPISTGTPSLDGIADFSSLLPFLSRLTIFAKWHDSRLVPWKHFVPMDNRFMDFWGIMEYFVGFEGEVVKRRAMMRRRRGLRLRAGVGE